MSLKSFFSEVETEFKKLFGSAPAALQTASAVITVVAPLVESLIALTGNEAAAAAIAVVVKQVEVDITAVQVTLKSVGSPLSLVGVLDAIVSNLKTLLTAGDIKDAKTLEVVTSVVNTIVAEFESILSVVKA